MMQHNESLLPQSFLEYLILFVIIVGVFVIAWFYSKLLNTKKLSDEVKRFENENQRLKQTFRAHNDSINLEENLSVIRAKRTRDRFGVLAKEDTDTNQFSLDLDNSEDSKKPIPPTYISCFNEFFCFSFFLSIKAATLPIVFPESSATIHLIHSPCLKNLFFFLIFEKFVVYIVGFLETK